MDIITASVYVARVPFEGYIGSQTTSAHWHGTSLRYIIASNMAALASSSIRFQLTKIRYKLLL